MQDDEHSQIGKSAFYNKKYGHIDCKGLEIFKNLNHITIIVAGVRNYKNGIRNLDILRKLPKLEELTIYYDEMRNYNFSGFKSLKKLKMI
jgi:hypothetical protein